MLLAEGSGVTSRLLAVCDAHGLVGGRRLGMLFAKGSGVTSRLLVGCDGGAYGTVVDVVNMRAAVGQNCRCFRFLTTYFDLESCAVAIGSDQVLSPGFLSLTIAPLGIFGNFLAPCLLLKSVAYFSLAASSRFCTSSAGGHCGFKMAFDIGSFVLIILPMSNWHGAYPVVRRGVLR